MARSFTGTNVISIPLAVNIGNTIAFWLKTTSTATNSAIVGKHSTSTRNGFLAIINSTANKLTIIGYTSGSQILNQVSTTTINDGNWHHVCIQWGYAGSSPAQLWIDGNLEASGTVGATWGGTALPMLIGKANDGFWANPNFEMAEFAVWDVAPSSSLNLNAGDIAALAKGSSPLAVRPDRLVCYLPMILDTIDIFGAEGAGVPTITGTSLTTHPRIFP